MSKDEYILCLKNIGKFFKEGEMYKLLERNSSIIMLVNEQKETHYLHHSMFHFFDLNNKSNA